MNVPNLIKVSKTSNPNSVAGMLTNLLKENSSVEIHAIGAGAVNQAVKSVAVARGYIAPTGIDLVCVPAFLRVEVEDEEKTGIKLIVKGI